MKYLLIALISTFVASQVFASKARLLSLSQDPNGSHYLEDTRNIFLNPSALPKVGEFTNFEMGSAAVPAVGTTPNAEGGYFRKIGELNFGGQLGRQGDTTTKIALANAIVGSGFQFIAPQNTIELMLGGRANVDWGVSLLYGAAERNTEQPAPGVNGFPNKKANTVEIGGGVATGPMEFYGHLNLISSSDNETASGSTDKYTGRPSLRLGGNYDLGNERKIYGDLVYSGFSAKNGANTIDKDADILVFMVGFVENLKLENNTRFFYTPALEINNYKLKDNKGGTDIKTEHFRIPLTIGIETDANDWLTLRGSVTQKVLIDSTKTTVSNSNDPNSTSVGAGAGIHWKKMTLDATLAGSTNGLIDGNNFFANAAFTYKF